MVRHIVMFWLRDNSEENIRVACDRLRSLTGKIDGAISLEAEANTLRSGHSCDLCLNIVFDSWTSLNAYRTHREHRLVQGQISAVQQSSTTADFALPAPARAMPRLLGMFGPACSHERMIDSLVDAGMDGMWLSLSHRSLKESVAWIEILRAAAERAKFRPELIIAPEDPVQIPSVLKSLGATHVAVSLPDGKREQKAVRDAIGDDVKLLAIVRMLRDFENLPVILSAADGIVIMRNYLIGDDVRYQLPTLQARAAQVAGAHGKPFIIASELLASMREKPTPLAAEISDIHQAVTQGASGLLLMRETSVGKFPKLAMETLRKAAAAACPAFAGGMNPPRVPPQ